jgi:hypothetical protein
VYRVGSPVSAGRRRQIAAAEEIVTRPWKIVSTPDNGPIAPLLFVVPFYNGCVLRQAFGNVLRRCQNLQRAFPPIAGK